MGFLNIFARVGSAVSPFVCKSLVLVHKSVPFLTMEVFGLICFSLLFTLPQTKCHNPKEERVDEITPKKSRASFKFTGLL